MSTVITVRIDDPEKVIDGLRALQRDWKSVSEQAFREAFVTSGVLGAIWDRTPKSDRARYASRYRGVDLRIKEAGAENDPATWDVRLDSDWRRKAVRYHQKKKTKDGRSYNTAPTMRGMDRISEYGNNNLAYSLMPQGPSKESLRVESRGNGRLAIAICTSVEYAARMHEAVKPAEGEYWTPGKDRGWSVSKSGNKFIEGPVEQYGGRIAEDFAYSVDRILKQRGLLP